MVQYAYYQHKLKQGYDAKVKLRPLMPGDLVLRKVLDTAKNPAWGKLGPNWEGPYRVTMVLILSNTSNAIVLLSVIFGLSQYIYFCHVSLSKCLLTTLLLKFDDI